MTPSVVFSNPNAGGVGGGLAGFGGALGLFGAIAGGLEIQGSANLDDHGRQHTRSGIQVLQLKAAPTLTSTSARCCLVAGGGRR